MLVSRSVYLLGGARVACEEALLGLRGRGQLSINPELLYDLIVSLEGKV